MAGIKLIVTDSEPAALQLLVGKPYSRHMPYYNQEDARNVAGNLAFTRTAIGKTVLAVYNSTDKTLYLEEKKEEMVKVSKSGRQMLEEELQYWLSQMRMERRWLRSTMDKIRMIGATIYTVRKGDNVKDIYEPKEVEKLTNDIPKFSRAYGGIASLAVANLFCHKFKLAGAVYCRSNHTIFVPEAQKEIQNVTITEQPDGRPQEEKPVPEIPGTAHDVAGEGIGNFEGTGVLYPKPKPTEITPARTHFLH